MMVLSHRGPGGELNPVALSVLLVMMVGPVGIEPTPHRLRAEYANQQTPRTRAATILLRVWRRLTVCSQGSWGRDRTCVGISPYWLTASCLTSRLPMNGGIIRASDAGSVA